MVRSGQVRAKLARALRSAGNTVQPLATSGARPRVSLAKQPRSAATKVNLDRPTRNASNLSLETRIAAAKARGDKAALILLLAEAGGVENVVAAPSLERDFHEEEASLPGTIYTPALAKALRIDMTRHEFEPASRVWQLQDGDVLDF